MRRRERRAAARGSQPPAELYQAGLRHMQAGRHLDAQICCKRALAADPDHPDILHLMGILCHRMQQYDHALEWISRAIRQDPRPLYLSSLGSTLQSQGRREEALAAFDKAVQLKPDDADSWVNLGNILVELERPIDAVLSFQHALKLNPRHWDAANKSGFVFYGLKDFEAALTQFDLCDRLQPNRP
jgi:tetratricopeptide (TPR) repeat protein